MTRLLEIPVVTRIASLTSVALLVACSSAPIRQAGGAAAFPSSGLGAAVDRDLARIRTVTASFRTLDSAVIAGYPREVRECLAHAPHGAMGYHHVNRTFVDDSVSLDHPEILLYERLPSGEYRLNGVEYIIPYRLRSRDSTPPTIMGQTLKQEDNLKLWYLHAWVWTTNPSGVFADYNPAVTC